MSRPHRRLIAVLLIAAASALYAQSPNFSANSNPTAKEINFLLKSSNPRLVAWGAYFASRNHDAEAGSLMIKLTERPKPPALPSNRDVIYAKDAMLEILYALIERKDPVPPKALSVIAPSYPSQALILASRLPITKATPLFEKWYYAGQDGKMRSSRDWTPVTLARVSAMMLTKAPPAGFAASILARSEENLTVYVTNKGEIGSGGGIGFGKGCGDGLGGPPFPGWPVVYHYLLEEDNPHTNGPVLVEVAGNLVTWRAYSGGWGSCFGVEPLNDVNRHHLLAAMLGIPDNAMPWSEMQEVTLHWQSQQKFLSDLKNEIASEEANLSASVEALHKKGLLTKSEAESVRPKLRITISDYRKSPAPPLPLPTNLDPRTFIDYFPKAPQTFTPSPN